MKNQILTVFIVLTTYSINAQATFKTDLDVEMFMRNKVYHNSDMNFDLTYSDIEFNTLGIVVKSNVNNQKRFFNNCRVRPSGTYADINCTSFDGTRFNIRVLQNKVIAGHGEQQEIVFNLKK